MSQRLVDAVHRLQIPQTRFPSTDLSQLWPGRQKLSQLNRLKICHFLTQITRANKFTQLPKTIFFMKTLVNVNPFSVASHFNLTRLVWVKANKFISFRFCDCYVAAGAGVGFQKIGDNFIPFLKSVLPRPNNAKCRVYIFKHIKPRKLAYYKSR